MRRIGFACTWRSYRYDVWIIIGVLMGGVAPHERLWAADAATMQVRTIGEDQARIRENMARLDRNSSWRSTC